MTERSAERADRGAGIFDEQIPHNGDVERTTHGSDHLPDAPGRIGEERVRFTDLLAAEWLKLWSLRSTYWALFVSMAAVVGIGANAAYADVRLAPANPVPEPQGFHVGGVFDAFSQGSVTVTMLAMGAVGAIAVVGEYSTGLIRVTFAAVPARRTVMTAKLIMVTGVSTVFGVVTALLSFGVTQWILSGRYAAVPLTDPEVMRVAVATALMAPLSALAGMAVGTLLRQTAVSLLVTVALLLLAPSLTSDRHRLTADVDHLMPLKAWHRLTYIFSDYSAHVLSPWSVAGAWTVYAVWAAVSALLVVGTVHRRDQ